jgi:hypothetical protein
LIAPARPASRRALFFQGYARAIGIKLSLADSDEFIAIENKNNYHLEFTHRIETQTDRHVHD